MISTLKSQKKAEFFLTESSNQKRRKKEGNLFIKNSIEKKNVTR